MSQLSLRVRLVAAFVLLLMAGLSIAGLAVTSIASNYLVSQLDAQLTQALQDLTKPTAHRSGEYSIGPGDFFIRAVANTGETLDTTGPSTVDRYGTPDLPTTIPEDQPFTVGTVEDKPGNRWRAVATTITARNGDPVDVYIARPLGEVRQTIRVLFITLLFSGTGLLVLGGMAADLMVRRALGPLKAIEATASAIASGDLSQRVPAIANPHTEVGSLSSSLNVMLGRIEEAFAARAASEERMRQFVADASHELRTPLATVRGYGELYRMGALTTPEQVTDTMGRIEDAARRMGSLVTDLLALARLDEGRPLRKEPVNLTALAQDSAEDLHALDPSRTVSVYTLTEDTAPHDVIVVGDEERLRQVLMNLIGNIARHTPSGTPATIRVGHSDQWVVMRVEDHGPGIAAEHADRIFERFFRVDTSRNRSSGGSGLGMAIVAAIVGAHRGHIAVEPTVGGGLTVALKLPRPADEPEHL